MSRKLDREKVRAWLAGQRAAEERIAQERAQRLASLTKEEARAEYEGLCAAWEATPKTGDFAALDRARAKFLAERRRRFDQAARARGYHDPNV